MKYNKKYFQLDLDFGKVKVTAFTTGDYYEGFDIKQLKEEVISQAINHNDIADADEEYVKSIAEITKEQYWAGKKAKDEEQSDTKSSQKVNTVNVVEIISDDLQTTVHSFFDNTEGNQQAEELFFKLCKENGYIGEAKNVDEFMDDEDAYWESGSYHCLITHSVNL